MAHLEQQGLDVICVEPEASWLYERLPASLEVSRATATTAQEITFTATVEEGTEEVSFYNAETGQEIASVLVDDATLTASLIMLFVDPGSYRIRAGHETASRFNERAVVVE